MTICTFPGCPHRATSHGLCSGHRAQRDRGAKLAPLGPRGPKPTGDVTIHHLRLRPETLAQLEQMADGRDPRILIRHILESVTSTAG